MGPSGCRSWQHSASVPGSTVQGKCSWFLRGSQGEGEVSNCVTQAKTFQVRWITAGEYVSFYLNIGT